MTLKYNTKNLEIGSDATSIKSYIVYIIIALLLTILLIIAYYLKWRSIKLNKQKELARSDFENELQKESISNKTSPIVYDKTIGAAKRKTEQKGNSEKQKPMKKSNFQLSNIEEKISYKDSIKNIKMDKNSNINLESINDMSEGSKSKLFRKYFVKNK